jgi:hypothetical protein
LFTAIIPVVITSSGRLFAAAARHFQVWWAFYRPRLWRHKVNPATPGQINFGCDKKVA